MTEPYEPDKGLARADGDRFAGLMDQTDLRLHRLENRRPKGGQYRYGILTVDSARSGSHITDATFGGTELIDWDTTDPADVVQPSDASQSSGLGRVGYGISNYVRPPSFVRTSLPEEPPSDFPEPIIHWALDPTNTYWDDSGTVPLTPASGDYSFTDPLGGVEGTATMHADWAPPASSEWTFSIVCSAEFGFVSTVGSSLIKFGDTEIKIYTLISDQGRMLVNGVPYGFLNYRAFYLQRCLFTFVYNGSNIKVYQNNTLKFTRSSETWDLTDGGVTLNVAGSDPFDHYRQEIYYFDVALTPAQINTLWIASVPIDYR